MRCILTVNQARILMPDLAIMDWGEEKRAAGFMVDGVSPSSPDLDSTSELLGNLDLIGRIVSDSVCLWFPLSLFLVFLFLNFFLGINLVLIDPYCFFYCDSMLFFSYNFFIWLLCVWKYMLSLFLWLFIFDFDCYGLVYWKFFMIYEKFEDSPSDFYFNFVVKIQFFFSYVVIDLVRFQSDFLWLFYHVIVFHSSALQLFYDRIYKTEVVYSVLIPHIGENYKGVLLYLMLCADSIDKF